MMMKNIHFQFMTFSKFGKRVVSKKRFELLVNFLKIYNLVVIEEYNTI